MKYIIFLFRAIWLALSLLILFFSMHRLSLLDSTRDVSELISLMSYGMMVICFPTGIVFFIALIFIGTVSDIIGVRIDAKWHLNRSQFGIRIDHDLASISDHSLASQSITIWHASDH